MQQLKGLKREFTSPLDEHDIALASINRHECSDIEPDQWSQ